MTTYVLFAICITLLFACILLLTEIRREYAEHDKTIRILDDVNAAFDRSVERHGKLIDLAWAKHEELSRDLRAAEKVIDEQAQKIAKYHDDEEAVTQDS